MNIKTIQRIFLVSLSTVILIWGGTEKKGVILKNERWTLENSPYFITNDILISAGANVVVSPGVKIIIGQPLRFIEGIKQHDQTDSFSIAITVQGGFKAVGRFNNRISICAKHPDKQRFQWYGIIIENPFENEVEIAYTDISHASKSILIKNGATPIIRNCLIEFNNAGIICDEKSMPLIINNDIARNSTVGIRITDANPTIYNNIIVYNSIGIWGDMRSIFAVEYNCIAANIDVNIRGCDPRLGVIENSKKNSDSTDFAKNIFSDPFFAGTSMDSLMIEKDITVPTDRSKIIDTTIAKVIHDSLNDSIAAKIIATEYRKHLLSKYSPCINSGKKGKNYNDIDGTRNDMGIYGGQEFPEFK